MIRESYIHTNTRPTRLLTGALVSLGMSLTPAISGAQDPVGSEPGTQTIHITRDSRHDGKEDAAAVLKAAGTFKTFLSLVERAKLTPLLTGAMTDTTPADVTVKSPQLNINLSKVQVPGGPPGMEGTVRRVVDDVITGSLPAAFAKMHAQPGLLTIFAPTDAAFAKLPKKELAATLADSASAAAVVRTHIINRGIYSKSFSVVERLRTLQGYSFPLTPKALGTAEFGGTDLMAGNALIHSLKTVLRPAS